MTGGRPEDLGCLASGEEIVARREVRYGPAETRETEQLPDRVSTQAPELATGARRAGPRLQPARSASVGGTFAARIAGYSPAMDPTSSVAPKPIATAGSETTTGQPWLVA